MSDGDRLRQRRWVFADCVFDEGNWTLTVGGERVAVEGKPLELLRELLLNAGTLVSKDDLLDAIWPDVTVVEASLPTAVRKLRTALNDDQRPTQLIETVPRIGYRLAGPVELEELAGAANGAITAVSPAGMSGFGRRGLLAVAGGLAMVIGAIAMTLVSSSDAPAARTTQTFSQRDAANALRRLDIDAVERLLAAGWSPNAEIGHEGSAALHYVVEMCEWNPAHDRNRLLLMVRTLHDGGARYDQRNVWGDTPYSIAKAPRYCGPDHPVTRSLHASCFQGFQPLGDRCLASYELARRNRP